MYDPRNEQAGFAKNLANTSTVAMESQAARIAELESELAQALADKQACEIFESNSAAAAELQNLVPCEDLVPAIKAMLDELEGLRELVAGALEAAPDLHWRRCRDCERESLHVEAITPWVLCRQCGSQDTRRMREKSAALAALKQQQAEREPCPDCGDPPGKCDCAKVLAGWLGELPTEDDAIDSLEYPSP